MNVVGKATVTGGNKVCKACGEKIKNSSWAYFVYSDENMKHVVAGPYCSETCAPDVEGEIVDSLDEGKSSANIGLRIFATVWYLIPGLFLYVLGWFLNMCHNVHGGIRGRILAFLSMEKHSYTHFWNFNYR